MTWKVHVNGCVLSIHGLKYNEAFVPTGVYYVNHVCACLTSDVY